MCRIRITAKSQTDVATTSMDDDSSISPIARNSAQFAWPQVSHIGKPATAFPETKFTQEEVGEILNITNPTVKKLLKAPHIQTRHLYLDDVNGTTGQPKQSQRYNKFMSGFEDIGYRAVHDVLAQNNISAQDVDVIVAVTSTGLALPGLTSMVVREFGMRRDIQRMDVVGMGCNGGMSGLRTLSMACQNYSATRNTRCVGLLVCCEVNSAFYVNNDGNDIGAGVVNSLFGDGAVATLVEAKVPTLSGDFDHDCISEAPEPACTFHDFESITVPEYFEDMIYQVDEDSQLLNFRLSKRIPFAMGNAAQVPIRALLERHGLEPRDIKHWVVHGGGHAVMQKVSESLGIDAKESMRHTISVMRDYGNLSSSSFLVSLRRLLDENAASNGQVISSGDKAIFCAMGPGATVEVAIGTFY